MLNRYEKRMNKYSLFLFVLFFLWLPGPSLYGKDPGWELIKNKDGIEIYSQAVEGSEVKGFKAISNINAPLEVVYAVLKDIPAYPLWYGRCKSIKIVRQYSDKHLLIYYTVGAPWPVSDRDLVADIEFFLDSKTDSVTVSVKGVEEETVPKNSKYVRMITLSGESTLTRIDKNKTRVEYAVRADIGGYVPIVFVNRFLEDQPYGIITGLRKMIKKEKYYEID